jgi:hypothetical protein
MKSTPRSSPTKILVMGFLAIILLGAFATYLEMKPINKLGPELDKAYGVKPIHCTLLVNERIITIETPSELTLDRFGRRQLGGDAFARYVRLTKEKTQVQAVSVLGDGDFGLVTRSQYDAYAQAIQMDKAITLELKNTAGPGAKYTLAPGFDGVLVALDVTCDDAAAHRAAQAVLHNLPGMTFVRVRRDGSIVLEMGIEARTFGGGAIAAAGSR